jgi:glutamine amidotransferase
MCRHLAYVGPPTTLAALLLDPPHGLLHQSYAPVDMRCDARVNADGFGAGWYPPAAVRELAGAQAAGAVPGAAPHGDPGAAPHGDPGAAPHGDPGAAPQPAPVQPARYRSDRPMWTDTGFAALAAVTVGTAVLAAVRAATVGMPVTTTGAAPFAEERWLFSHNGVVFGWPDSVTGLAAALPVRDLLTLDAPSDAALLWALVRHRLRQGHDPAAALVDTVVAAQAAAPGSRINLLLTDGATVWATTWTHSLWVRAGRDAVTVSSEPVDDAPGWAEVPDRHLLVAAPARYELRPLVPAAQAV